MYGPMEPVRGVPEPSSGTRADPFLRPDAAIGRGAPNPDLARLQISPRLPES